MIKPIARFTLYSEARRLPAAERLKISADLATKIKKGQVSTPELLEFITNPAKEVRDINERIISAIALLDLLDDKKEYLTSIDSKKILKTIEDEYNYPCEGLDLGNKAVIDHNHLNLKITLSRIIARHSSKTDLNNKEINSFQAFIKLLSILKNLYGSFNLINLTPLIEDLKESEIASFTI